MNWHNLYDPFTALILRSPLHGMLDRGTMLITVTGRKSGKRYTTPLNYIIDGDTLLTVSLRHRTWWRNLRGGAPIEVRLKGATHQGRAEACADDAGVTQNLLHYLELTPQIAKYMDVKLDQSGQPHREDIARAAKDRVMVRAHLNNGGMHARNN
jgi:deazaflavin-dependent oxidoreductase (nitroreductase family)